MKLKLLCILCIFFTIQIKAQENKYDGKFYRLGLNYGFASVDNPIFFDYDYFYQVQLRKFQIFYKIKSTRFIDYEFIFQPEVNTVKHRLTSDRFIYGPSHPLWERRDEMKTLKTFNEYVMNFGLIFRKHIQPDMSVYFIASLGPGYVEKDTERMTKGIGFSDNLGFGISKDFKHFYFDTRIGYRHVSNANLNDINHGYDAMVIEIGIGMLLN
ncbi:acyloxyacyl hydrolase [Christiangramia sp. SM2212]|uniref:Acyloxyacyl hydrolase n=1 Tax=Christiangramia sediminicola TaxID=3073267 RepID=A0ABU1END7_9FLAO|nr:acyloxyacyl hydrolase [Christiangramia sp. SM2212]MDR5589909.1 acyloxyacyl hydrolase [Christiangramia sp. SM2212]